MEKSKLLDIFRIIPSNEHRLFLEYVQSPYFNKREDVIKFCQYLIKQSKEQLPSHKLKSTYCWQILFPSINYNKKEMAYLMNRLNSLAESFLGQRNFEKKESIYPISSLESLAKNQLKKHYQLKLKKIKTDLKSSPLEDSDNAWLQYKVVEIEDFYFNLQNQREISPFLDKKSQFLDHFFIQKKTQLFCTIQIIKDTLNIKLPMSWPQPPSSQSISGNNSVLYAYHSLYQLLHHKKESESQFLHYKSLLPTLKNKVSHREYIDMFSFALNHCLLKINKGKRAYTKHLLSLYEDGLSHGSLLLNNELSPWMYKNIVNLGLGLKRFEWTQDFITNYSKKLPENQRKDAYYFNLANLNFYQKNLNKALGYLNEVEFTDVYYKYGSKSMLLEIYFEKSETEAFYSLESSFKILLLRDKILTHDIKTSYLNFIRFTAKLYKLKNGRDENKLTKLRAKIEQTPNINGRNWVIGQLKEIEG